jgi:hypothetical protein
VRQRASDRGEVLNCAASASRQVDYQSTATDTTYRPRERRKRRRIETLQAHQLREPGSFPFYDRFSGFGSIVARGDFAAELLEFGDDVGTRAVFSFTARGGITDGQDGGNYLNSHNFLRKALMRVCLDQYRSRSAGLQRVGSRT